jgi:hypothetical protein
MTAESPDPTKDPEFQKVVPDVPAHDAATAQAHSEGAKKRPKRISQK